MDQQTRILLVEDHPLTRDGTALALKAFDPQCEIRQSPSLAHTFRELDQGGNPDLILLDLDLEDSHGIETLIRLREWCDSHGAASRIVILSGTSDPALIKEVIEHYATGFIVKATSPNIFAHAIAITLAGGVYIPEQALRQLAPISAADNREAAPVASFTSREREVAACLVRGFTYKRIARELERRDGKPISEHTVRAHVGNIAWKLGVMENAKAGVMAEIARRGLVFP